MKKWCAYLDVLGFRQRLADWPNAVQYYERMNTLTARAEDFHHNFAHITKNYFKDAQPIDIELFVFSDSVIITAENPWSLISLCRSLQFEGMTDDIWFRGAISYGEHLHRPEPRRVLMVSQALSQAYEWESTRAIFPRILIDPGYIESLAAVTELRGMKGLLVQGEDDLWLINPFIHWADVLVQDVGERIRSSLASAPNQKVQIKFEWLAALFNYSMSLELDGPDWSPLIELRTNYNKPQFYSLAFGLASGGEIGPIFRGFSENSSEFLHSKEPPNTV
jgi:hypothetical protein